MMRIKHRFWSSHKVAASIAAGVAAITLGVGGYAVANSSSSSGVSGTATAPVAGQVVPFQQGQPGLSKQVGQVPAAFTAGSGTIVTGTAADQAAAAASAAFPGGTINRVVLLSDGQYNVHIIGVNWPHHVF
ncbi:MAG: hypothetical protein QOD92_1809, partial [Acidimicrobiaceae bacterium]